MASSRSSRRPTARCRPLVERGDRSRVTVEPDVETYLLQGWAPRGKYEAAAVTWARDIALASRPSGHDDARSLASRCLGLAVWLLSLGYTLDEDPEQLLGESLLNTYLAQTKWTAGTVQTTRSALRRVRQAVTGERRLVLPATRTDVDSAVIPVSDAEVEAFLRWVDGIDPSRAVHHNGHVLVALIRGAGCTKSDLDRLDVTTFRPGPDGALLIDIGHGADTRTVTVTAPWADVLSDCQQRVGSGCPLAGQGQRALKRLESRYYKDRARLDEKARRTLPPFLNANTYRAAWLLDRLASGQRLDHLLTEAGLVSAASLDRYLQFLPDSTAPRTAR